MNRDELIRCYSTQIQTVARLVASSFPPPVRREVEENAITHIWERSCGRDFDPEEHAPPRWFHYLLRQLAIDIYRKHQRRRDQLERLREEVPFLPHLREVQDLQADMPDEAALFEAFLQKPCSLQDVAVASTWPRKARLRLLCVSRLWYKFPEKFRKVWLQESNPAATEMPAMLRNCESVKQRCEIVAAVIQEPSVTVERYWHRNSNRYMSQLPCISQLLAS